MKEIFIGNYGLEQVGQTMTATGWVANIRNHGKLAFIELRDREGLLQVFVGSMIGMMMSLIIESTILPKAPPMITPTARSMTNFKKSTFIQTFLSKLSPIQFIIFHFLNELS